jgi:hypothetical protein
VSSKLASLVDLDTVLGTEDLYDLLEILAVDTYNQNLANREK